MSERIYIILYDISDDKKRLKAAAMLERNGYERLQLSVFTGLQPPYNNGALWKQLEALLKNGDDKLCCIEITKANFENMKMLGNSAIDKAYLSGEKHVLII